ncbi:MAG: hypothetical protein LM582_09425, partial [Desulfurococcaceae archaeon]|nr:hypothetical protein [Desulfurococcaceae archaeon]
MGQEFILSILSIVIPSISAILSIAYATYRVGKKFGEIDEKFKRIDERFNELKDYVDTRIARLGRVFSSYQEFFVEYLSVKGVISEQEATMIKNEASR